MNWPHLTVAAVMQALWEDETNCDVLAMGGLRPVHRMEYAQRTDLRIYRELFPPVPPAVVVSLRASARRIMGLQP